MRTVTLRLSGSADAAARGLMRSPLRGRDCAVRIFFAECSCALLGTLFGFQLAHAVDHAFDPTAQFAVEGSQAVTFLLYAFEFQPGLPVGSDESLHALFELFEFVVEHVNVGCGAGWQYSPAPQPRSAHDQEQRAVASLHVQQQLAFLDAGELLELRHAVDALAVYRDDDVVRTQAGARSG